MKLRITKRTRAEAALICEIAASAPFPPWTITPIVRDLDADPDSGDVADEASDAVCLDNADLNLRECWAEAAQRLREGWTP